MESVFLVLVVVISAMIIARIAWKRRGYKMVAHDGRASLSQKIVNWLPSTLRTPIWSRLPSSNSQGRSGDYLLVDGRWVTFYQLKTEYEAALANYNEDKGMVSRRQYNRAWLRYRRGLVCWVKLGHEMPDDVDEADRIYVLRALQGPIKIDRPSVHTDDDRSHRTRAMV